MNPPRNRAIASGSNTVAQVTQAGDVAETAPSGSTAVVVAGTASSAVVSENAPVRGRRTRKAIRIDEYRLKNARNRAIASGSNAVAQVTPVGDVDGTASSAVVVSENAPVGTLMARGGRTVAGQRRGGGRTVAGAQISGDEFYARGRGAGFRGGDRRSRSFSGRGAIVGDVATADGENTVVSGNFSGSDPQSVGEYGGRRSRIAGGGNTVVSGNFSGSDPKSVGEYGDHGDSVVDAAGGECASVSDKQKP